MDKFKLTGQNLGRVSTLGGCAFLCHAIGDHNVQHNGNQHNTLHNDTQHNGSQHNDTQHIGLFANLSINNTRMMALDMEC
jgi:hypothetical protein